MPTMQELMEQELSIGNTATITLKNGKDISGTIVDFDQSLFRIRYSNGHVQPISYDLVGTYSLSEDILPPAANLSPSVSGAYEEIRDSAVDIMVLQKEFRKAQYDLYQACSPMLDSLNHAIKISELATKFARTPRIISALQNLSCSNPGNPFLLALLGEIALLVNETGLYLDTLSYYEQDWAENCYRSHNILRLLVDISLQVKEFAVLRRLSENCPPAMRPDLSKALLYMLMELDIPFDLPPHAAAGSDAAFALLMEKVRKLSDAPPEPCPEEVDQPSIQDPPAGHGSPAPSPEHLQGKIIFYNAATEFGFIKDAQGAEYRFVSRNLSEEDKQSLKAGLHVWFTKGRVYSPKQEKSVDCAENISIVRQEDNVHYGYITLFMLQRNYGYMMLEEDYNKGVLRGNIRVDAANIAGEQQLDTHTHHYRASFQFADDSGKQAVNVKILESIPIADAAPAPARLPQGSAVDFGQFQFVKGETLVIHGTAGKKYVGQYVDQTEHGLSLQAADGRETAIPFEEMASLFFCGLITSYNVLSSSGRINDAYTFRISNVASRQLAHLLKLGKYAVFPCLYSLIIDGPTSYISSVEYFPKEIREQFSWKSGKILGLYKSSVYISVDHDSRCYESTISDNTILQYLRENDFLGQEVFYKTVCHRTVDEYRKGPLSTSVIDICSKYQLGKVKCYPGQTLKGIQCSPQVYPCSLELEQIPENTAVKVTLGCNNQGSLVAVNYDLTDLSLPSYAQKNRQERAALNDKIRQAELDGDYELQLSLLGEMLERSYLKPEQAIEDTLKICAGHGRLPYAARTVQTYSYLLPPSLLNGAMMQISILEGDMDAAAGYARSYLTAAENASEFLASVAMAAVRGEVSPEALREHIMAGTPLQPTPKIGYFDQRNRSGYILWEKGKLNFSYKDLLNYDSAALDPQKFIYHVSFDVDRSKAIPKACNVRIVGTEPKERPPESPEAAGEEITAYSFDYNPDFWEHEIQFSSAAVMTLLEFKRDKFDLNAIIGYLPKTYRTKIKGGEFVGNAAEAKTLITALRNCYKKTSEYRAVPPETRPNLLLVAAKIHKCFPQDDSEDFFSEKTGNSILFDYAFRYLSGNNAREQAEVEYYCESVFQNGFTDSVRYRMEARCLAEFFAGTAGIDLNGCGERSAIISILKRKCVNPSGLSKMLLNLPEPILNELLECAPPPLLNTISDTIIVRLNDAVIRKDMDRKDAIKQYYTRYHLDLNGFIKKLAASSRATIDNAPFFLEQFEHTMESVGKYLFDADEALLERVKNIVNTTQTDLQNENVGNRTDRLQLDWNTIGDVVQDIERHPSKLSFESLRPFLINLQKSLTDYLNNQYEQFRPKLSVRHYSLRNSGRQETVEVSNEPNRLPANNVKVVNAVPYGQPKGFSVDTKSRSIFGNGNQIRGGTPSEINIPILLNREIAPDVLELSLTLTYEYTSHYDGERGVLETTEVTLEDQKIQIPLNLRSSDSISKNPYSTFANGAVMKPENPEAEKMFFGRNADLEDIYHMLTDADGKLKTGSIVAIYGQKRCGKSSVMFFLGKEIETRCPGTIVLDINAQSHGVEGGQGVFYRLLLTDICTKFKIKLRQHKELRAEMGRAGLTIPGAAELAGEFGEAYFNEFFQEFQEEFGNRYTILLMVDEFTQIYIHMKQHRINEDFLNRWRAMIQNNGFVNIIVGQDFMDKFTTDEDITSQNMGGTVNGLGTMGRKRLTYLGEMAARRMIEEPVRLSDGGSRYRGLLGKEAIDYIYDLTGGSAFYLMKFCNALVNYMMDQGEQLVSKSLVDTVARGYVFDTLNNPISKTDFDPIFNEYSYKDNQGGDDSMENGTAISLQVQEEIKKTYQLLKNIADISEGSQGVCKVRKIAWPDPAERNHYLRSLMVRGVLTDRNGRDITTEQIDNLDIKIKVRLFSIWLKERG